MKDSAITRPTSIRDLNRSRCPQTAARGRAVALCASWPKPTNARKSSN